MNPDAVVEVLHMTEKDLNNAGESDAASEDQPAEPGDRSSHVPRQDTVTGLCPSPMLLLFVSLELTLRLFYIIFYHLIYVTQSINNNCHYVNKYCILKPFFRIRILELWILVKENTKINRIYVTKFLF